MREDWIECKLIDLVEYSKGKKPSNLVNEQINSDYKPYINIKAFEKGIVEEYSNDLKANYCQDGDLLMVWDGARAGLVGKAKNGLIGSTLMKIEPHRNADKEFVFYYLKSLFTTINTNTKGVGIPHVEPNLLWNSQLILFPLPEQRAIVKKLESLLSSLDAGVADLKKAQQQLKMYRQAVLKKAFEGEWDKKKIIETCSNIKVGIVIKPTQFYSSDNTGVKVFRSANVKEFRIQDSNWVYFSLQGNEINKRTQVKEDDILIVRTGYPGTSCIVTKEYVNTNAIDILIATPDKNIILPKYLCAFNNSPYGKGLFSEGSRGVAQKHLNVGVYSNLIIPVPPIKNQLKIIKQLESGLSVCDSIEQNIKESLEKAEALRQSILKRAFEGNLLTAQELAECKLADDYEPASVLLERIKAEHSKVSKPKKKTKTT